MKKIDKLKKALQSILIEFRSVSTDNGVLSWNGEDDITTGTTVYVTDEEGVRNIPEDGNYIDEEGITYVVENGNVIEIIPAPEDETPVEPIEEPVEEPVEEQPEPQPEEQNPQEEVEPEPEPVEEPVEEPAQEPEETPAEEPVEEPAEEPAEEPVEEVPETIVEEVEEVVDEANAFKETVDSLVARIAKLEEEITKLKEFQAVVEKMSAGKPAQQEFKEAKVNPELFKNNDLKNLNKLFQQ